MIIIIDQRRLNMAIAMGELTRVSITLSGSQNLQMPFPFPPKRERGKTLLSVPILRITSISAIEERKRRSVRRVLRVQKKKKIKIPNCPARQRHRFRRARWDVAGDSNNSLSSSEKLLKTLISFPTSKSMEDDNSSSRICVICLTEDGKSERGKLDSCDHYFCFVCIMEWARIESKCPACKGRFSVVHRIPKDSCLLRERIVKIPIRNQVHTSFGNASSEPYDPYAYTHCSVCKGVEDEGLLLLCDLCDSAAHTYCIGLGANVPEGDWFCRDCTISRAQHADTGMDTSGNDQNNVSISDIIQKSSTKMVGLPYRRVPLHQDCEAPSIVSSQRNSVAPKSFPNVDKATGTGARTLDRCRDIHGHIRVLRENWGALRRGSLSFPSSSSTSCGNSSKQDIGAALNNQTSQPCFSTSRGFQQSSKPDCNKSSYDVEKAWKMMEIAKTKAIQEGMSSIDQTLRYPARREPNAKEKNTPSLFSHTVKSQQCKIKEPSKPVTGESNSLKKETGKQKSSELGKQPCHPVASKKHKACNEVSCSGSYSYRGSSLSNAVQTSQGDFSNEISRNPSTKIMDEASSTSRTIEVSEKVHAAHEMSNNGDVKSEIQTLVKINLKLVSRDRNLGYKRFKEVARLSTHTIMAACGLEPPPKSSMQFFSSSVCSHSKDVQQLHRSTLMPDSCRECFVVFVKHVVNTILSEKIG